MARFASMLATLVGFLAAGQADGSSPRAPERHSSAQESPAGTAAPVEQSLAFVPYVSRGHILVFPTITPTPLPSPTPIPPPEGFDVRCDASGSDDVCSWLSSGEPGDGTRVEASVRAFIDGRPVSGRKMTVRWVFPYPTLFKYCDAETGDDGVASCGVDTPRYPGQGAAAQIALSLSDWPFQRQISFRLGR